jgi:hypothetical protein
MILMAFGDPTGVGRGFTFHVRMDANSVDQHVWFAHRKCKLLGIKEIHSVAGGAAAAVRPRKITADATAPGAAAGATVLELSAAIDLTTTANTAQTPAVTTTGNRNTFLKNEKLALDFSGTLTGLVGMIEFHFVGM